jgi:hypothetical protein
MVFSATLSQLAITRAIVITNCEQWRVKGCPGQPLDKVYLHIYDPLVPWIFHAGSPCRTLFESIISLVALWNGSHTGPAAWRWWKGWQQDVLVQAAHCQCTKRHRNSVFASRVLHFAHTREWPVSVGLVKQVHESNSHILLSKYRPILMCLFNM